MHQDLLRATNVYMVLCTGLYTPDQVTLKGNVSPTASAPISKRTINYRRPTLTAASHHAHGEANFKSKWRSKKR